MSAFHYRKSIIKEIDKESIDNKKNIKPVKSVIKPVKSLIKPVKSLKSKGKKNVKF